MGKYNTVRSELWTDKGIKKLSLSGKLLYHYLLSSPLSNIAGYYHLPIIQIKTDLCRWDENNYEFNKDDAKKFKEEVIPALKNENKLWRYDPETEQVFIPTYLKYNKIGGGKQLKAINNAISTLTLCSLHMDFLYSLETYVGYDAHDYLDNGILKQILKMAENDTSEAAIYINNNISII